MENWVQEVITKWKSEGVKLNPPATISDINETELALNFKFPIDFKNLYLTINGFHDYEWQEHMFSLWSLSRVVEEFNESNDKNFIGFCDFLICSHTIGFVKNQSGVFKSYNYLENNAIAETCQEAIRMINSSADTIY